MPQPAFDTSSAPEREPARFIVGMPRAATTWLCKCFNEHPHTAAFGESMFFGRRYVPPQANGRYSSGQVEAITSRLAEGACLQSVRGDGPGRLKSVTQSTLPDVIEAAKSQWPTNPTPAELFNAFARCIAAAESKQCAIEKTPHHLNWLDRIFNAFPAARVVILLREPYAFMLSYKHQGDRKPPEHRKRLARLYHPLACAMVWRASMRSALAARAAYGEQVHFVEQDDITADAAAVLEGVQRFFGLEPVDLASKVPQDNTSFPGGARPQLKVEDLFWMNLVAGRTISRAGYTRRPIAGGLHQPWRVAWSVLRLPVWAVGCLFTLRRIVDGSLVKYITRWFRPARATQADSAGSTR